MKKKNIKVFDKILGSSDTFTLENQIFNAVTFSATIAGILIFLFDLIIGLGPKYYVSSLGMFVIFFLIYRGSRNSGKYKQLIWIFIFLALVAITHVWYLIGGLVGSPLIFLLAFIVSIPMMLSGWQKYVSLILAVLAGVILYVLELMNPGIVQNDMSRAQNLTDMFLMAIIKGIGIFLLVSMVVRSYHEQQTRIKALNRYLGTINNRFEERNVELERALKEVKTLKGILPFCSSCKKIRDDKGYWNQIEKYIQTYTGADLSHGICPDCARELYGDLNIKEK